MDGNKKWDMWFYAAVDADVPVSIAHLGRSVIRDYWEHGRYMELGEGPYLGADQHHQMMIALGRQKPDLAEAVFMAELAIGAPDQEELDDKVREAEFMYADNNAECFTREWYANVYHLDGCEWRLV